jgi:hypothetical protein
MADAGQCQQDSAEAAIDDQHEPAPRQLAAYLRHHLPHPIDAGLVPSLLGLLGGPAQRGEKRQRSHPPTPRHRPQEHDRDPFQAEAPDDRLLGGRYRIAIAPIPRPVKQPSPCPLGGRASPPGARVGRDTNAVHKEWYKRRQDQYDHFWQARYGRSPAIVMNFGESSSIAR